jgi:hypothetical protein
MIHIYGGTCDSNLEDNVSMGLKILTGRCITSRVTGSRDTLACVEETGQEEESVSRRRDQL